MRPVSTEIPPPLPPGLLAGLAAQHKITLFLDYDGTISEITPDVANARPVTGAAGIIERISSHPERFRVVIISGRQADKVASLVEVSGGITFVGNHGLEILEPGSGSRMAIDPALFMPALDIVRAWLRANVPPAGRFVIEDKRFSVALHYRLADPGAGLTVREAMRQFVGTRVPELTIREGKMVIEAVPHAANKGAAVQRLVREDSADRLPIYFGDDLTDEDAFFALREAGIAIKVCAQPAPSWARYRVASPEEAVAALAQMAAAAGAAVQVN